MLEKLGPPVNGTTALPQKFVEAYVGFENMPGLELATAELHG